MTTETKHTPGPWRQGERHPCRVIGKRFVAYCCDPQDEGSETDEEKANARLIAAAPKLLELAYSLRRICSRQANLCSTATEAERLQFIHLVYDLSNGLGIEAIAQAEGEEPTLAA